MKVPKKLYNDGGSPNAITSLEAGEMRELLQKLYALSDENKKVIDAWSTKHGGKKDRKPVELVNVHDLISLPQLAPEFGYHPDYLRRLAVNERIKGCYFIGGSWVTTRAALEEYQATKSKVGRPKSG